MSETPDARAVLSALAEKHAAPWLFFQEVRFGTGYNMDGRYRAAPNAYAEKRIDAWTIHPYPSEKWRRVAYEVKVTRADFLREIKAPAKRKPALVISNEFYFAAPRGIIKPEELPPEAGLMELADDGRLRVTVQAVWRDTPPPSWGFLAALTRELTNDLRLARTRVIALESRVQELIGKAQTGRIDANHSAPRNRRALR